MYRHSLIVSGDTTLIMLFINLGAKMKICYKTNPNDYAKIYRYNQGGDMKLSNAQRLLGVDLTLEKVFEAYNKIPKKMAFLEKIGIEHKTVSRWRLGINEPLYHKFADFYEYIKEELENESN